MAKTYNTIGLVSAGDPLTETIWNEQAENVNNYREPPTAAISGGSSAMTGIVDNTSTLVTGMSTVVFDTDTMTGTADRLTVTTAGIYLVHGSYVTAGTGTNSDNDVVVEIVRFNSSNSEQEAIGQSLCSPSVGVVKRPAVCAAMKFEANDYVRLRVRIDASNNAAQTINNPRLQVVWVGQVS